MRGSGDRPMTKLSLVNNTDAMALAAAGQRRSKDNQFGAEHVAQVVSDHSALDPAAIQAAAAAPFSLSARSLTTPS